MKPDIAHNKALRKINVNESGNDAKPENITTPIIPNKTARAFKFEIITPQMQIEERNSAYQFFKP